MSATRGKVLPRVAPCSRTYYERAALSWNERLRREFAARQARGQRFDALTCRQAS